MPKTRMVRKLLVRTTLVIIVVSSLGFLFIKTAKDAASEAYTIRREHLQNWTVVTNEAREPQSAVLILRPPPIMPTMISQQIFLRRMEGLIAPNIHGIPLLLRSEFDKAFATIASVTELATIAENIRLTSEPFIPHCLGARDAGTTRANQIFFVLFESQTFTRFRKEIGTLLEARGGQPNTYHATTLHPALVINASGNSLEGWSPTQQNPEEDCLAPLRIE